MSQLISANFIVKNESDAQLNLVIKGKVEKDEHNIRSYFQQNFSIDAKSSEEISVLFLPDNLTFFRSGGKIGEFQVPNKEYSSILFQAKRDLPIITAKINLASGEVELTIPKNVKELTAAIEKAKP